MNFILNHHNFLSKSIKTHFTNVSLTAANKVFNNGLDVCCVENSGESIIQKLACQKRGGVKHSGEIGQISCYLPFLWKKDVFSHVTVRNVTRHILPRLFGE